MNEMPTMMASSYTSQAFDANAAAKLFQAQEVQRRLGAGIQGNGLRDLIIQANNQLNKEQQMPAARIVKVYIADPNENLPLDKRVLHSGDEQLTDLTDQELFFEVPIAELLAKHNELRKTTIDKAQAEKFGRDIFLEPARIRDLKMVVVSVATF